MRSRKPRRRAAMSTPRSSRKPVTARSRPRFSPRRSSTSPRTTTSSTWRRIQPATAESAAAELSTPWRTTGCADDQLLEYRQSVEHVALQGDAVRAFQRLHPSQQVDLNLAVLAFGDTETGHVPEHPLAVGEERELEGQGALGRDVLQV